jgi:hypothetical protein
MFSKVQTINQIISVKRYFNRNSNHRQVTELIFGRTHKNIRIIFLLEIVKAITIFDIILNSSNNSGHQFLLETLLD